MSACKNIKIKGISIILEGLLVSPVDVRVLCVCVFISGVIICVCVCM